MKRILKNVLILFCTLTLILGYLPNTSIDLFASDKEEDCEEDEKKTAEDILKSVIFTSNQDKDQHDINVRGSYTGEDDNYFYLYYLAKKRQTNVHYSTLGFNLTPQQVNPYDGPTNGKSIAFFTTDIGIKTPAFQDWAADISSNEIYTYEPLHPVEYGNRYMSDVEWPSSDGVPSVATLLSYKKSYLKRDLVSHDLINKLNWGMKNVNGYSKTGSYAAYLYLQAIQGFNLGSGFQKANISDDLNKVLDIANKNGFSSESQWDLTRYYNYQMYLKAPVNTLSYIDIQTGKVVSYQVLESKIPDIGEIQPVTIEKNGPVTINGSHYDIVGGAITPADMFNEGNKYSGYLNQIIFPNSAKGIKPLFKLDTLGEYSKWKDIMNEQGYPAYVIESEENSANSRTGVPYLEAKNNKIKLMSSEGNNSVDENKHYNGTNFYIFVKAPQKEQLHVLYYEKTKGTLVKHDIIPYNQTVSLDKNVQFNNKVYKTIQTSYRENTTSEKDIKNTVGHPPVMNSSDKNVSSGLTQFLPTPEDKGYVVRAEVEAPPEEQKPGDHNFTIPSQWLGKQFAFGDPLFSNAHDLPYHAPYTHTYHCSDKDCSGHTCTVTVEQPTYEHNAYWTMDPRSCFSPLNYMFADPGTSTSNLTRILKNSIESSGQHVTGQSSVTFFSHRADIDAVNPIFASYMEKENTQAKAFLKSHSMTSLVHTGLTPNGGGYNKNGGSALGKFIYSLKGGSGWKYDEWTHHSSCGSSYSSNPYGNNPPKANLSSPETYTNGAVNLRVNAEPMLVADPLPVGSDFSNIKSMNNGNYYVIKQTDNTSIPFYPTYKMFIDNTNAWLLGREQRKLKAVNVAEIKVLNTDEDLTKVETTWSRDAQDTGKLNMKGGYQFNFTGINTMQVQVTTYTVVPKEGYVENASTLRTNLLKNHNTTVSTVAEINTGKYVTNLPESYLADAPSEFIIGNPYKKSGDNTSKSRLKYTTANQVSVGTTQSSIMSLESLDNAFGTDNKARLNAQLQKKDWYQERFEGFEVVKQTTTITIKPGTVTGTNFIRNGGKNYNDVARSAGNIPAHKFGAEFILYSKNIKFFNKNFTIQSQSRPFYFNVRGTAYDDRV